MAHKLRTLVVHPAYAAGCAVLRPATGICVGNAGRLLLQMDPTCMGREVRVGWPRVSCIPTQDAGVLVCAVAEQPGASQRAHLFSGFAV